MKHHNSDNSQISDIFRSLILGCRWSSVHERRELPSPPTAGRFILTTDFCRLLEDAWQCRGRSLAGNCYEFSEIDWCFFFWGGGGARSSGRDSATGPHDHHGMWYVVKWLLYSFLLWCHPLQNTFSTWNPWIKTLLPLLGQFFFGHFLSETFFLGPSVENLLDRGKVSCVTLRFVWRIAPSGCWAECLIGYLLGEDLENLQWLKFHWTKYSKKGTMFLIHAVMVIWSLNMCQAHRLVLAACSDYMRARFCIGMAFTQVETENDRTKIWQLCHLRLTVQMNPLIFQICQQLHLKQCWSTCTQVSLKCVWRRVTFHCDIFPTILDPTKLFL